MRRSTPRAALLTHLIRQSASPAGVNRQCPTCGEHYETSDPAASYPHNNH